MLKDHNRSTRARWEISSKLTRKTPERRYGPSSNIFIANCTYFTRYCRVSIVDFD